VPSAGSHALGRSARRERRKQRFGRFLWFTALGTLIPGTGLIAAGRRGWGRAVLTLAVVGVVGLALLVLRTPRNQLAMTAFDRDQLTLITLALVVVAGLWLIVALASHRALEPTGLPGGKRFAGATVVIVAASLVLSPLAIGARYAWTQHDLLGALSRESSTAPDLDKANPWEDKPRVNVLLLGSDAGEGRQGARPDTLILTSIDTDTGDAVMFSLPRQLANVPFPPGTPLHERFPFGFRPPYGPDSNDAHYWLNAVYTYANEELEPHVFAGSDNPGADATKLAVAGALGLDVDYYVMADLTGFQQIVDAMGGITIDVHYPIPIATKKSESGSGCTPAKDWILPGEDQKLTGYQALWFGRARCSPGHPEYAHLPNPVKDDHNRMERQRCVMGAIAQRAEPMTLLTNFESLAAAAESTISTDIPADMWPAFAELGLKVKGATIASLAFNNKVLDGGVAGTTGAANFDEVRRLVDEALDPTPDLETTREVSNDPGVGQDSDEDSQGSDEPAPGSDDAEDDGPGNEPDDGADVEVEDDGPDATAAADISATC
jgi:anionic cell wall polymer biosynthesis LytR-Cps2A-Psr (LCP) family protein